MVKTEINLNSIEIYLDQVSSQGRSMLLPALHEAQKLYGWVPREVQDEISKALRVPLADIHGVIEFYTMFYNQPTAKRVIRICDGPACRLAGVDEVIESLESNLNLAHGETNKDKSITYEHVPCLGLCEFAPAGIDDKQALGELSATDVDDLLNGSLSAPTLKVYGEKLLMLKRVNKVDPDSLESYEELEGYQGLRKALEFEPDQLIEWVETTGILGRGGAQFPTGTKWKFTRGAKGAPRKKHIVINADESEPGTFKDRYLMEGDPFSIIEAAAVAGYAVGAENGWIFVRGEYSQSYHRLENAVQLARKAGYLGKNILGKENFHFDIQLRLGAGAYICGEETALFEAIEGKRGFPRIKPPFPTTNGLFDQPTAINNVETVVAVLAALTIGVDKWKNHGTKDSPGTRLFCLSGNIQKPGVYEVPFGITLGKLIELAGGVPKDKKIKGILMGGAAGIFVEPEQLDFRLTYEDAKTNNIPLGSGVVMVFDEAADLNQTLQSLGDFFAHESCGKCFPCQIGTQRQMEILERAANGSTNRADKQRLHDIGFTMTETSLCGLGQTAASAVLSAIELWPELIE